MNDQPIENPVIWRFGLMTGLVNILYVLLLYLINPIMIISTWGWLAPVFTIVMLVLAGLNVRTLFGGAINFKKALKVVFLTYVISALLLSFFYYSLYNFIDTELGEILKQEAIENIDKLTITFGGSDEVVDRAMEELEKQEFTPTLGQTALNFLYSCIFGIIISLIIAAIIKKKTLMING